METTMTLLKTVATALSLSVGPMTFTSPARADASAAVIAGAAGFAAGTLFGSAAAPRAYYARPYYGVPAYYPPRYYVPRRVYYPYPYRYRHPIPRYCYPRYCW
jgi:hypothetical protein